MGSTRKHPQPAQCPSLPSLQSRVGWGTGDGHRWALPPREPLRLRGNQMIEQRWLCSLLRAVSEQKKLETQLAPLVHFFPKPGPDHLSLNGATREAQGAADGHLCPGSVRTAQGRRGSWRVCCCPWVSRLPGGTSATLSFPPGSGPGSRSLASLGLSASKALTSVGRRAVLFGDLLNIFVTRHSCAVLSPTRFSYTNQSLVNLSEKKGRLCARVEQPPQRFASTLNLLPQLCSLLSQRFSSWKPVSGGASAEVTSADLWGTAPSPLRTSPRRGAAVTGPLRPGCHTSSSFPLRFILPAGSTHRAGL